jgi:HD superfamily phosphohydrolase
MYIFIFFYRGCRKRPCNEKIDCEIDEMQKKIQRKKDVVKEIFDNVYGFIGVNQLELDIIDHPLFQRLKSIKQLGMAYTVFPGAMHTRFSHSLGVMHLVTKIGKNLLNDELITTDELSKLRLAALLHDIGHYPLSHTIESPMLDKNKKAHHENLGQEVLKNFSISDIINSNFDAEEIGSIFNGRSLNKTFTQLIHSELDVDRMDYLLRDSYNTGVRYGQFDYEQLLRKISVADNKLICVDYKAIHAVENYLTSRYYMYSQVYSHKTIGSFDQLVYSAYIEMEKKGMVPDLSTIQTDEEFFCNYEDHYIVNLLKESAKQSTNRYLQRIAKMILKRKHLNLAWEVEELINFSENKASPKYILTKNIMDKIDITDLGDVPKDWIFFDTPDVKFSKLTPYFNIKTIDETKNEMSEAIYIQLEDGTTEPIVSLSTSIIKQIASWRLKTIRVFTLKKYTKKLKGKINQLVPTG